MTPLYALALAALLTPMATVPPARLQTDAKVLAAFHERITEYVEIHRTEAAGLGNPALCADPEELTRQARRLAAAIRNARPLADEGDIFTAAVATAFRARIATAMRAASIGPPAPAEDDEFAPEVHATMAAGVWRPWWAPVLRALPDLPPELEYQFVGRHLVLVDARANLVVDVLRFAIPHAHQPPDLGPADACEVHPDLPACWM